MEDEINEVDYVIAGLLGFIVGFFVALGIILYMEIHDSIIFNPGSYVMTSALSGLVFSMILIARLKILSLLEQRRNIDKSSSGGEK